MLANVVVVGGVGVGDAVRTQCAHTYSVHFVFSACRCCGVSGTCSACRVCLFVFVCCCWERPCGACWGGRVSRHDACVVPPPPCYPNQPGKHRVKSERRQTGAVRPPKQTKARAASVDKEVKSPKRPGAGAAAAAPPTVPPIPAMPAAVPTPAAAATGAAAAAAAAAAGSAPAAAAVAGPPAPAASGVRAFA